MHSRLPICILLVRNRIHLTCRAGGARTRDQWISKRRFLSVTARSRYLQCHNAFRHSGDPMELADSGRFPVIFDEQTVAGVHSAVGAYKAGPEGAAKLLAPPWLLGSSNPSSTPPGR